MSIIAEDGTARSDAESYISVDDCLAYHNSVGNSAWALLTTPQQEQALRRATYFMLGKYRLGWLGQRVKLTQALDWPRVGVVIEDYAGTMGRNGLGSYGLYQVPMTIVPNEVKQACAELALRASAGPLQEDLTQDVLQETIGPVTVKYDPNSDQQVRYVQVDNLIRIYLKNGGNSTMARLVRT